ncbi:hypothetical protein COCON_G00094000, partial [Conger conger]
MNTVVFFAVGKNHVKAGTEKGGCEDTPISVSDSKISCLGNRIPYPTKCVGKLSAPGLSHSSMRRLQAWTSHGHIHVSSCVQTHTHAQTW